MLTESEKATVTEVFERLGPERVARGAESTAHNWLECFLGRAFQFQERFRKSFVTSELGEWSWESWLAKELARLNAERVLPNVLRMEFLRLWDAQFKHADTTISGESVDHVEDIRALAAEWLEQNRVPVEGRSA